MIETGRKKEKVILVAAALDDLEKAEQSLNKAKAALSKATLDLTTKQSILDQLG